MNLEEFGWNQFWRKSFDELGREGLAPARVAREDKEAYLVLSEDGELTARVSGSVRHNAQSRSEFPAVGDWVVIEPRPEEGEATIHAVLPRKSRFSRKAPGGRTEEQVLAANIDTVFLVSGLDENFNIRRIERYVTLAWDSGADPVIVVNKADICDDVEARVSEVKSAISGVPVHAISGTENTGLDVLLKYISTGRTVVFLGSSGVGKSTIINSLLGEERQKVNAISEAVGKGKHTTTHRELILFPDGAVVIDTPGMRELQMWCDDDGLKRSFDDIEELTHSCRFRDCRHAAEPGCAVRKALDEGVLEAKRYGSYLKLQKEVKFLARREDQRARLIEEKKWKKITMDGRKANRDKW